MRSIVLLSLLCACSTLSNEDRERLASHQRNAALFYDGGKLEQALGQIERGLELEPDDYKLLALKGAVLLRASGDAQGTDHRLLDQATQVLEEVFSRRSATRHEPYVLLNYALALQKQGLRHLGDSIRSAGEADRAVDAGRQATLRAEAADSRQRAHELLGRADGLLAVLTERGELLRLAHKHRLQIARQLGDDAGFVAESNKFLAQTATEQAFAQREVERTTTPGYEQQQLALLGQLREEELEVRALLAEHHYARHEYEAALAQLNRVLELDPTRSVDYYNRGRVLDELQQPEAAKADFRRFVMRSTLPASSDKMAYAMRALQQ